MAKNGQYLTKHQLEIITEAAIREYEKRQQKSIKEKKDRRLRNTELLLKNYRKLSSYCDLVDREVEECDGTIYGDKELTLESLSKYTLKTAKMMRYFKNVYHHYEQLCKLSPDGKRRLMIIQKRFIEDDEMTVKELHEKLHLDQSNIYRDIKKAIADLSVLLYGIDALELE